MDGSLGAGETIPGLHETVMLEHQGVKIGLMGLVEQVRAELSTSGREPSLTSSSVRSGSAFGLSGGGAAPRGAACRSGTQRACRRPRPLLWTRRPGLLSVLPLPRAPPLRAALSRACVRARAQEWLETLPTLDPDTLLYADFVSEGERLAAELRVRACVCSRACIGGDLSIWEGRTLLVGGGARASARKGALCARRRRGAPSWSLR